MSAATSSAPKGMTRSRSYLPGNLYLSLFVSPSHFFLCDVFGIFWLEGDDVNRPHLIPVTLRNECCLMLPSVLSSLVLSYATPDELDQQLACSVYEGAVNNMHILLVKAAHLGRYDFFRSLRDYVTMDGIRAHDNDVLRVAAENGHTEVLVELRLGWKLTAADARAKNNYALKMAAYNGHTEVLVELRVGWGLTAIDARAMDNTALRWAAERGHTEVLVELRRGFQLNADNARAMDNYALRWAAEHGHIQVLVELRLGFQLNAVDARVNNNYALRRAAENGHTAVLDEFRLGWGLDVNVH